MVSSGSQESTAAEDSWAARQGSTQGPSLLRSPLPKLSVLLVFSSVFNFHFRYDYHGCWGVGMPKRPKDEVGVSRLMWVPEEQRALGC